MNKLLSQKLQGWVLKKFATNFIGQLAIANRAQGKECVEDLAIEGLSVSIVKLDKHPKFTWARTALTNTIFSILIPSLLFVSILFVVFILVEMVVVNDPFSVSATFLYATTVLGWLTLFSVGHVLLATWAYRVISCKAEYIIKTVPDQKCITIGFLYAMITDSPLPQTSHEEEMSGEVVHKTAKDADPSTINIQGIEIRPRNNVTRQEPPFGLEEIIKRFVEFEGDDISISYSEEDKRFHTIFSEGNMFVDNKDLRLTIFQANGLVHSLLSGRNIPPSKLGTKVITARIVCEDGSLYRISFNNGNCPPSAIYGEIHIKPIEEEKA